MPNMYMSNVNVPVMISNMAYSTVIFTPPRHSVPQRRGHAAQQRARARRAAGARRAARHHARLAAPPRARLPRRAPRHGAG